MNKDLSFTFVVTSLEEGMRADRLITSRYSSQASRAVVQQSINGGMILVNGKKAKKGVKLFQGDLVTGTFLQEESFSLMGERISLEILYEDEDLLCINKACGMVVHPAPGHSHGTLVQALLAHCPISSLGFEELRPGIVHRLDKDTSGVLVVAKTEIAHLRLKDYFQKREVDKRYHAICLGSPSIRTIDLRIGRSQQDRKKMAIDQERGREALTHLLHTDLMGSYSLVELQLKSGRTHQARVHLAAIGHPIVGDPLYGNQSLNRKIDLHQQLLHASYLAFPHPLRVGERVQCSAPLRQEMVDFIRLHSPSIKVR